jgi:Zn-finger protein
MVTRRPRAWAPPAPKIWLPCAACGRLGHVRKAVTVIVPDTGERVWQCADCGLPEHRRKDQVARRLGMTL